VRRRTFVLGSLVLAVAGGVGSVVACGPEAIPDKRRTLLSAWGETLLETYAEFEAACVELDVRARAFCDNPGQASLDAAREAWWSVRAPWKRTEIFAFGPYADEPIRLGPKLDFWPSRPDSVQQVLDGANPITAESAANLGAPARGMPAIEILLWAVGDGTLTAFQSSPRRCEYLVALTSDLIARARDLRLAWDPENGNFLSELTHAGEQGRRFASLHLALGEVVNRLGYTVENIRTEKLGRPAGTANGGSPQPDKVESPFSGRSLEDIRDNLRGVEQLYFGAPGRGRPGLEQYLNERGRSFASLMRSKLELCHAALNAIGEPLAVAVVSQPDAVRAALERLAELQRAIQVDVIGALSLSIGFNDNDGD